MSASVLRPPSSIMHAPRDWDTDRQLTFNTPPAERVELPSIRQAVPEIQLRGIGPDAEYSTASKPHSPNAEPRTLVTPPGYSEAPHMNKRRRLSSDDDPEYEARQNTIPRLYRSPNGIPQKLHSTTTSPTTSVRRASILSTSSARNSPRPSQRGLSGTMRSPPYDPTNNRPTDWRPTLPSLPSLGGARERPVFGDYSLNSSRSGNQTYPPTTSTYGHPLSSYHHTGFTYGYQQPRGQSYSGPSSHERTPFTASPHHNGYPGSSFPYSMEINEAGHDSKQRKRRGNLPKETTDKLRAWFVNHLQHPYPTEDEKQELMRQTGLQMNQISNWFINARRRQLPAMINSARVESDARSARGGEGREGTSERGSLPLGESDGDGSGYEEEYSDMRARHGHVLSGRTKRESV